MLNTMWEFLHLMRSQRRQLYLSLLLSFLDGILLMLPVFRPAPCTRHACRGAYVRSKDAWCRLAGRSPVVFVAILRRMRHAASGTDKL